MGSSPCGRGRERRVTTELLQVVIGLQAEARGRTSLVPEFRLYLLLN